MNQFRVLPTFGQDPRVIAEVVNGIMNGKTNNTGTVSLNMSATNTVIQDRRISQDSVILFMPLNENGAAELAHGHMYVSSRGRGTATITHGNHTHEMLFAYVVIG
jgi:hypothetical protein